MQVVVVTGELGQRRLDLPGLAPATATARAVVAAVQRALPELSKQTLAVRRLNPGDGQPSLLRPEDVRRSVQCCPERFVHHSSLHSQARAAHLQAVRDELVLVTTKQLAESDQDKVELPGTERVQVIPAPEAMRQLVSSNR